MPLKHRSSTFIVTFPRNCPSARTHGLGIELAPIAPPNLNSPTRRLINFFASQILLTKLSSVVRMLINEQTSVAYRAPTEVLRRIFEFATTIETERDSLRIGEVISHVSSLFRCIILTVPRAWRIIDFPLYWPRDKLVEYITTLVVRAATYPVNIDIRDGPHPGLTHEELLGIFQSVFKPISNVEEIYFHITNYDGFLDPIRFIDALPSTPHSITLYNAANLDFANNPIMPPDPTAGNLCYSGGSSLKFSPDSSVIVDSPNFSRAQSCKLIGVDFSIFPTIGNELGWQELILADRSTSGLSHSCLGLIMAAAPSLERLIVDVNIGGWSIFPRPDMAYIKELYVRYFSIRESDPTARRLHFPRLGKFSMGGCDIKSELVYQFFKNHPTITDLTLGKDVDLKEMAKACPQIRRLSIVSAVIPELFPQKDEPWKRRKVTLSPRFSQLEHLHIDDSAHELDQCMLQRILDGRVASPDASQCGLSPGLSILSIQFISRRSGQREPPCTVRLNKGWVSMIEATDARVRSKGDDVWIVWNNESELSKSSFPHRDSLYMLH